MRENNSSTLSHHEDQEVDEELGIFSLKFQDRAAFRTRSGYYFRNESNGGVEREM